MRKAIEYRIDGDGRDSGKLFVITEMPSEQAFHWGMKALLAVMKSGIDMPEGFENSGMAGVATVGLKAISSLDFDTAKVLLDELMGCVKFAPDPNKLEVVRKIFAEDIEDPMTLSLIHI